MTLYSTSLIENETTIYQGFCSGAQKAASAEKQR